jgi:[acyl-carrier-protein] S-malonyltransferase
MKKIAVFPGQGSQVVGMGKSLYETFPQARLVFEEVEDTLKEPLSQLIFEGPADKLNLTEHTQPALMCVSAALLRVMQEEFGFKLSDFSYVAGHSLGEYTALLAANVITLPQAARLLKIRGQAMQEAVPVGQGKMCAILGLTLEEAESVVAITKHELPNKVCALANDNSPGQVVLSGHTLAIELAMDIAKGKGAKRCLPLPVSAPFHSPLMEPAAVTMDHALKEESFAKPIIPIICNITARSEMDPNALKRNLIDQVCGRVRWTESITYAVEHGITHCLEIGAGKVLTGLVRRIASNVTLANINDELSLQTYFSEA